MRTYYAIPYKRNPLFTGREHLLADLDTFFVRRPSLPLKLVAVIGMPGIGKTELALEYAYRQRKRYRAIIWLDARGDEPLAQQIVQVLKSFGVVLPGHQNDERIFQLFRTWLRQSHFLLIVDQVDTERLLNDLLDEEMQGHVIITRSSRKLTGAWNIVMIEPFDEQESTHFLLRRAGLLAPHKQLAPVSSAERQAAEALHREFGGHPLALDQAGAYVSETGSSLAEYLRRYRRNPRVLLERRGTASATHPFPAYSVIAAMRQGAAYWAQELLFLYGDNRLDCSDPSPRLPSTLRVSSALREEMKASPSSLRELRAILIQQFLLVPLTDAPGRWGIHPLVRTVMKLVKADEKEQARLGRAQEDLYEPLDEEGLVHLLLEVQRKQHRLATLQRGSDEAMELARAITTTLVRLRRAVLPASRKKRERAWARLEGRYGELAFGKDAPLTTASQDDLRRYAQELLSIMEYR